MVARPEISHQVGFGGRTEAYYDAQGRYHVRWIPDRVINGTPYDMTGIGYRVETTSLLRLWKAEATESFDLSAFNAGDYYRAVERKVASENLTKVLYPNDSVTRGKQLVVLIGQKKALAAAIRNNRTARRFSGLLARLQ
jgi:starch phosphorylase